MKIICNVDRTRYDHKPQGQEVGSVQNRLTCPEEIDLAELADVLVTGGSMRISACNGRRSKDFITGQLIGVNTDNSVIINMAKANAVKPWTPEMIRQVLAYNGIKTALQYFTWSNATSDVPKFRTLIALDRPVNDINEYRALILYVYSFFNEYGCDIHTTNVSQIFFGSDAGIPIYIDEDAANSADELLSRCVPHTNITKAERKPYRVAKPVCNMADGDVVNAIATQNAYRLRKLLGNPDVLEVDNKGELFDAMYSLDMAEILGVDEGTRFCCILPEHMGRELSATVYQDEKTGHWLYTCFSHPDGRITYNFKQLCEAIGDFKSEYHSIRFICKACNIKLIETDWSREQINNIDLILHCLLLGHGEDVFNTICPTAAITAQHALSTYIRVLFIARNAISPQRNASKNIIFSTSVCQIARWCGKPIDETAKYIKLLEYHRLLLPVKAEDVPDRMRIKAIEHAYADADGDRTCYASFYQIPLWVVEHIKTVEG